MRDHQLFVCGVCGECLPQDLFSKTEKRKKKCGVNYAMTCTPCRRNGTAQRNRQPLPGPSPLLGRVADSGIARRPNNFGYCNYIDMLFGMRCFSAIVSLGSFGSAKDVSESMAAVQAASRHFEHANQGGVEGADEHKSSDVLCLCIGDGSAPRTAVLCCFLKKWICISIDPALSEEWQGDCPKGVEGLTGFGGTLEEYMSHQKSNISTNGNVKFKRLIMLCVHSHARFIGPATVRTIRHRYGNIPTTIVSLPCCPRFRHVRDIGRKPDLEYEDDCVFSACRKVQIWNFLGDTPVSPSRHMPGSTITSFQSNCFEGKS